MVQRPLRLQTRVQSVAERPPDTDKALVSVLIFISVRVFLCNPCIDPPLCSPSAGMESVCHHTREALVSTHSSTHTPSQNPVHTPSVGTSSATPLRWRFFFHHLGQFPTATFQTVSKQPVSPGRGRLPA